MTKTFTEFKVYQKSILLAKEFTDLQITGVLKRNMALKIRLKER